MPGRDITRLPNKAARGLVLLTFRGVCRGSNLPFRVVAIGSCRISCAGPGFSSCPESKFSAGAEPPTSQAASAPQKPDQDKPVAKPGDHPPITDAKPDTQNKLTDEGVFVLRKDVDEVLLHASVIDDKQHMVTNLDEAAFTVFEDGKPQNIISFHHVDIPVAMGIVIDNSGSMREKRNKVNQAALNLVRSSNPPDEVFVVNFNDEQYLDQDFTNDLLKLKEALDKIDARGGTALYDAVVASADHLKKNGAAGEESDFRGDRRRRQRQQRDAGAGGEAVAQENGPSVYAIGDSGG